MEFYEGIKAGFSIAILVQDIVAKETMTMVVGVILGKMVLANII